MEKFCQMSHFLAEIRQNFTMLLGKICTYTGQFLITQGPHFWTKLLKMSVNCTRTTGQ
jgi:hypothetical protein